jgi:hypothetical protein
MNEWAPGMTRSMLRGRTAYWYSVWMLRLAACEVVLCVALVLAALANQAGMLAAPLLFVVVGLFAVNALVACVLWAVGEIRQRREVRAGYTTVFDAWKSVDQVDDRTGQVIRLANEQVGAGEVKTRRRALGHVQQAE